MTTNNTDSGTVSEEYKTDENDIISAGMDVYEICANPTLYDTHFSTLDDYYYVYQLYDVYKTMDPKILSEQMHPHFDDDLHRRGREKLSQLGIIYPNGTFRRLKWKNKLGMYSL